MTHCAIYYIVLYSSVQGLSISFRDEAVEHEKKIKTFLNSPCHLVVSLGGIPAGILRAFQVHDENSFGAQGKREDINEPERPETFFFPYSANHLARRTAFVSSLFTRATCDNRIYITKLHHCQASQLLAPCSFTNHYPAQPLVLSDKRYCCYMGQHHHIKHRGPSLCRDDNRKCLLYSGAIKMQMHVTV